MNGQDPLLSKISTMVDLSNLLSILMSCFVTESFFGWNVKEVKPVFSDSVDEAAHVSTLLLSPDVDGVLLVGFSGHEQTGFFGHVEPQQVAHKPPLLNRFVAFSPRLTGADGSHAPEKGSKKKTMLARICRMTKGG